MFDNKVFCFFSLEKKWGAGQSPAKVLSTSCTPVNKTRSVHMKTRDLVLTAFFAAITVIFSVISIPIPISPVPFSLSLAAIFLAGALLPKNHAALAQVVYILLGVIGLPVFSKMQGGPGVLVGPTGGYLIAYPIMAYLIALIIEKTGKRNFPVYLFSMLCSLVVCYTLGTLWLSLVAHLSIAAAFAAGVLPFAILDVVKAVLASLLALALYRALSKRTVG
jgi:biotin transport system substrate-specific component